MQERPGILSKDVTDQLTQFFECSGYQKLSKNPDRDGESISYEFSRMVQETPYPRLHLIAEVTSDQKLQVSLHLDGRPHHTVFNQSQVNEELQRLINCVHNSAQTSQQNIILGALTEELLFGAARDLQRYRRLKGQRIDHGLIRNAKSGKPNRAQKRLIEQKKRVRDQWDPNDEDI